MERTQCYLFIYNQKEREKIKEPSENFLVNGLFIQVLCNGMLMPYVLMGGGSGSVNDVSILHIEMWPVDLVMDPMMCVPG